MRTSNPKTISNYFFINYFRQTTARLSSTIIAGKQSRNAINKPMNHADHH
jgi:hypothetical protein